MNKYFLLLLFCSIGYSQALGLNLFGIGEDIRDTDPASLAMGNSKFFSGNSKNILNVLKFAKKNKIYSVGFLGNKGGMAKKISNLNLIIPSSNTARIQEAHIFLGHYIFEQVENLLFKKNQKT